MEIKTTSHGIEVITSAATAPNASVIWLHGLGADGNDFVPIAPELRLPANLSIRFIFPHAPVRPVSCNGGYEMRAWYDIYSLDELEREDEAGIMGSDKFVQSLIQAETHRGIPSHRIILMGFSQGGAIALYSGLRYPQPLAGIGALSTYLPLRQSAKSDYRNFNTPIFMAHGLHDPVVQFAYGETSCALLKTLGYTVRWKTYDMEHNVCSEEIADIAAWLTDCLPPLDRQSCST